MQSIDKENITLGELEERAQAGDQEAIEFWEKEISPMFKEMGQAISLMIEKTFEDDPSKPFFDMLRIMAKSENPVHRAIIRPYDKWTLKKVREQGRKLLEIEIAESAKKPPTGGLSDNLIKEPLMPPEPKENGGKIDLWLDWYHSMLDNGYKCTLEDVARKSGYSLGYIKQKHMVYRAKPNQTSNQI